MQRATVRLAALKRAEKGGADKEGDGAEENWEGVEPMEVLEGAGASTGSATWAEKYPELEESSDDPGSLRSVPTNPTHYQGATMVTTMVATPTSLVPMVILSIILLCWLSCSSLLYMRFMDDISQLQKRVTPHVAEYRRNIEQQKKLNVS